MVLHLDHLTDEELLHRLQAGDEGAFSELYRRYWEKLFEKAYARMKSAEIARDLVQDLFVQLWLKKETLHIHTSIAAYLFVALRNAVLNHAAFQAVRTTHADSLKHSLPSSAYTTHDQVVFADLQGALQQESSKLSPKCREAFELSQFEDLSVQDIAQRMNLSPNTVRNHLQRAMTFLRIRLKDYLATLLLLFLME
jgi:RNA polymerase sigma-70 factor (family 1)